MDVETARPSQPAGKGVASRRSFRRMLNPIFRFFQLALSVCALSVILASSTAGVLYQDIDAFAYLLAGSSIAAAWALGMLLLDAILCAGYDLGVPSAVATIVACDFIALAFALSGGAAALAITTNILVPHFMLIRAQTAASLAIIAAAFFLPTLALNTLYLGRQFYVEEPL